MATLTFDGNEDSQNEARVLVEALTEWLKEQPEQVPRPGKARFTYRADGTLDSVLTAPVDGE